MVEMTIVGGQIRDLAGRFIDFAVPELLTVFGGWRGIGMATASIDVPGPNVGRSGDGYSAQWECLAGRSPVGESDE
jgi:hypothetical protein